MNIFRQTLKQVIGAQKIVGRFIFKHQSTATLGSIARPEIEIELWSDTHREWQRYSVLVDTGADYTIMPRYVASLLSIAFKRNQLKETFGLGGSQKVFFVPEVRLKVGQAERTIPIGFVDNNQIPPLLGRHQAFETFTVLFNGQKDVFFAE